LIRFIGIIGFYSGSILTPVRTNKSRQQKKTGFMACFLVSIMPAGGLYLEIAGLDQ